MPSLEMSQFQERISISKPQPSKMEELVNTLKISHFLKEVNIIMSSNTTRWILKDLKEIESEQNDYFRVLPNDDNIYEW